MQNARTRVPQAAAHVVRDSLSSPGRMYRLPILRHPSARPAAGNDPAWLFDLDNTLHDTSHAIFKRIDTSMALAVQRMLDVDEDTAHALRQKYWRRYGATMIGLVRHHGVDPRKFLALSHDFDIAPLVRSESAMAHKLQQLRGRKILLTNAPLDYACAVLDHMNCLHLFDSLWGIEEMRLFGQFRPKPSRSMLRHILVREGLKAGRTILVEDTLENLTAARAVGLRTAYIYHPGTPFSRRNNGRPAFVDVRVRKFGQLLREQQRLR